MAVAKNELMRQRLVAASRLGSYARRFSDLVAAGVFSDKQGQEILHDPAITEVVRQLQQVRCAHRRVYIVGNGGSAAVASHIVNDFCNTGGLCATTLHEPALLTCYANDYGYEQAYARCLERSAEPGDLLIAISSSGSSANIINAVRTAKERGVLVFTLSGFGADNPLRQSGDINFWIDADAYGAVEVGHLFVLHYIADQLAEHGQDPLD